MQPPGDPYRARDEEDRDRDDEQRSSGSRSRQFTRGVGVAFVVDTLVNVPHGLFMPLVRPHNVALAMDTLLVGVNILVGYAGGRAAGRAGLAHDDSRAQWSMAWTVTLLSTLVSYFTLRAALYWPRVAPAVRRAVADASSGRSASLVVQLVAALLLIRFGFAIGTWMQARRDGRAFEDDDSMGGE